MLSRDGEFLEMGGANLSPRLLLELGEGGVDEREEPVIALEPTRANEVECGVKFGHDAARRECFCSRSSAMRALASS